jgi:16S rRNA (guanine(527)-N(7))-methyltransferase RsmG
VFRELLLEKLGDTAEMQPHVLDALQRHYDLLVRWNQGLNLTSIQGIENIIERHYCEAVFLGVHLPAQPLRIVDIGSGAGFPGFPVGVLRPDCEISLVEAHQRKAVFLQEASRGSPNICVLPVRAEEVGGRFDHAICRAVSYRDLKRVLKALAPAADLLTGEEGPPGELGFEWATPTKLPWGRNRFLRSGVSRETQREIGPRRHT